MSRRLGSSCLLVPGENAPTIGVTPETWHAAAGVDSPGSAAIAGRTDAGCFLAKLGPAMRPRHYGEV